MRKGRQDAERQFVVTYLQDPAVGPPLYAPASEMAFDVSGIRFWQIEGRVPLRLNNLIEMRNDCRFGNLMRRISFVE
jgi:hypothetical protein